MLISAVVAAAKRAVVRPGVGLGVDGAEGGRWSAARSCQGSEVSSDGGQGGEDVGGGADGAEDAAGHLDAATPRPATRAGSIGTHASSTSRHSYPRSLASRIVECTQVSSPTPASSRRRIAAGAEHEVEVAGVEAVDAAGGRGRRSATPAAASDGMPGGRVAAGRGCGGAHDDHRAAGGAHARRRAARVGLGAASTPGGQDDQQRGAGRRRGRRRTATGTAWCR